MEEFTYLTWQGTAISTCWAQTQSDSDAELVCKVVSFSTLKCCSWRTDSCPCSQGWPEFWKPGNCFQVKESLTVNQPNFYKSETVMETESYVLIIRKWWHPPQLIICSNSNDYILQLCSVSHPYCRSGVDNPDMECQYPAGFPHLVSDEPLSAKDITLGRTFGVWGLHRF